MRLTARSRADAPKRSTRLAYVRGGAPFNADVRLHMARTQKAMHTSVAVLFLIAFFFYFLGFATPAIIFSVIGVVVEATAWITWFATSLRTEEPKGPDR